MVFAVACMVSFAVAAAEKTITVAEGQTVELKETLAAAGLTLENNDTLVKTGGGRLVGSTDYSGITVHLRVVEGVFEGRTKEQFFKAGNIAVRSGATLDVNNTGGGAVNLLTRRNIFLQGAGSLAAAVTVKGRALTGALLIRGTGNSYQIMDGCHFYLDGADATIAATSAGNMGYLTNAWIEDKNGSHTLTLLGPGHALDPETGVIGTQYEHRFRYGSGFTNMTGRIVVDGASLTAHNVAYKVHPDKFPMTIKSGGTYGQEGASFGACISRVTFEWGGIVAGDTTASITLPPIAGLPAISSKTTATIDDDWTAPAADLALDRSLVAYKALTFGAKAKVRVDDYGPLDGGIAYTLARSTASVAGCPVLEKVSADPTGWKVECTADGKSVVLSYEIPAIPGLVNVRDWGLLPGEENAAANDVAFAAGLASLDETPHVLFFPAGTLHFTALLAVSEKSGLTLLGDNRCSRIQVADDASAVLSVVGGSDVTVTGLALAGGAGVAVAADGTANLVVTNNLFASVPGAIADVEGAYPVLAKDCTDVIVRENVARGVIYAGPVHAAGSTAVAGVEPTASEVVLYSWTDPTDISTNRAFSVALAERGLAEFPQGAKLVKKGDGRLDGPALPNIGNRIGSIDVREGTFRSTTRGSLGPDGANVTVADGASLMLEPAGTSVAAMNTKFSLGGTGAATVEGAVLSIYGASWQETVGCTFSLWSDATFAYYSEGSCGLFSSCTLDQNGHTLTLRGELGRANALRFRLSCLFRNSAPIIADNITVSASYKDGEGFRGVDGKRPPLLKIKSNARLLLNNQDFADVFEVYDFEPGGVYEAESSKVLFTSNVKGAPEVCASVELTISKSYTARAADLLNGKKMVAQKSVAFAEDCVVDVEGAADLPFVQAGYVLVTSAAQIPRKPVRGPGLAAAGWTTALSADGKSLLVKPVGGTLLLVR